MSAQLVHHEINEVHVTGIEWLGLLLLGFLLVFQLLFVICRQILVRCRQTLEQLVQAGLVVADSG
jgi:cell division protein FtsB